MTDANKPERGKPERGNPATRAERLAKQLRENLKKRKAQARKRRAATADREEDAPGP